MSLYDDYEKYLDKYIIEYGKDTIILYRCGGFYEIYSIDDGKVPIKRICDILNIQMSKRNKSIIEVSRSNSLMCGFPHHALGKFINLLVNDNFTVVIVDQITDPPKPQRAVTNIISPGTDLNYTTLSFEANNLMCIYIEQNTDFIKKDKLLTTFGISIIDLSTGISKVFEISSKLDDITYALDETYRIIQIENPKEFIILNENVSDIDKFIDYLEIKNKCIHKITNKEITNINYQTQLLKKIFPKHGLLSVIEYLDMEKMPYALCSYVYLLQFSFQHNEKILEKIKKPEIIYNTDKLILSFNCVKHLNIITNDNSMSLLQFINKSTTSIGKRLFKDWLLNPITNIQVLEKRYDSIDYIINNNLYDTISKKLSYIYDIERIYRKMNLQMIQPCEIIQLTSSIEPLIELFDSASEINNIIPEFNEININQIKDLYTYIRTHLNLEEIQKVNIDNISTSFFNKNIFQEIDSKQETFTQYQQFFDDLTICLNNYCKKNDNVVLFKVDNNLIDGYHLVITSKRLQDYKDALSTFQYKFKNKVLKFADFTIKQNPTKTLSKISHPFFKNINELLNKAQDELILEIKKTFNDFINNCTENFSQVFLIMIKIVGQLDVFSTCAKNAISYKYYKPNINNLYNKKSYITGKNLRHPIIERINNTEYIANDISIGTPETNGILLYGTNMVGKSSYMKSIGISIIMAQAGMFVPCQNFNFYPYDNLFTRIPSGDDLFKGQSTFAVEISELRNILKRVNQNSLVIGDELASGTESISAISIVASGIMNLYNKKTSFILATHLHDLTKLKDIGKLDKLKIYHLSVIYDEIAKKLIFNRKLQEGQGSTLYGLEVCRALDMGNDFILTANKFRQELLDINSDIVNTKKSKYNTEHFVDICSICGKNAEEVHHIKQQSNADNNGFIGHMHKNSKYNLMNVCTECHDKIHNNNIKVNGYIQTSDGVELDIIYNTSLKDENIDKLILSLRKDNSIKKIKEILDEKYPNEKITLYKIRKILNQS